MQNLRPCGLSPSFPGLSPARRQITHVLLTRPPLGSARRPSSRDLHVLSTPPAFVLSQDQTLQKKVQNSSKQTPTRVDVRKLPLSLYPRRSKRQPSGRYTLGQGPH